jgi:hypothetical protein
MKKPQGRVRRVISGGQTGADRGGLDAAIDLGIPHGGWCPKGRRAEDGTIPQKYPLQETDSTDYPARTERNVTEADGTVVFTFGPPARGSVLTLKLALKHRKPTLHVDLEQQTPADATTLLRKWIEETGVSILNVAGSREGSAAGIQKLVWQIVKDSFSASEASPVRR